MPTNAKTSTNSGFIFALSFAHIRPNFEKTLSHGADEAGTGSTTRATLATCGNRLPLSFHQSSGESLLSTSASHLKYACHSTGKGRFEAEVVEEPNFWGEQCSPQTPSTAVKSILNGVAKAFVLPETKTATSHGLLICHLLLFNQLFIWIKNHVASSFLHFKAGVSLGTGKGFGQLVQQRECFLRGFLPDLAKHIFGGRLTANCYNRQLTHCLSLSEDKKMQSLPARVE